MATSIDRRAEEPIIRDLYPRLRRFAAAVGPREVDPDDLVQEALVRTLSRRSLASLEHPAAYLWVAITRLAADSRRSLGRRRDAIARLGRGDVEPPAYPSDLSMLDGLEPTARAVLYLHEVEGFGYADVATMLGRKEASLRRMATRARRRLAATLTEEEHGAAAR